MSGRAVVFGAASWNTMIQVDRLPEGRPGTAFPPAWHETVGASGAGKAMNLARLGVPVTLRCLLGEDGPGQSVRTILEAAGVVVDPLVDRTGTSRHVNLMDPAGRRLSYLLHTGDAAARFDDAHAADLITRADHVFVGISDQTRPVLEIARRAGKPTWTDLHATDGQREWERDFWSADHVFFSGEALTEPRPFMERLHAAGRRLVVCTLAERGALALSDDGRWIEVQATPVARLVDTNGAGDAFLAGTAASIMRGLPIDAALALAARVAALAVQSPELAPGSIPADLLAALA